MTVVNRKHQEVAQKDGHAVASDPFSSDILTPGRADTCQGKSSSQDNFWVYTAKCDTGGQRGYKSGIVVGDVSRTG